MKESFTEIIFVIAIAAVITLVVALFFAALGATG